MPCPKGVPQEDGPRSVTMKKVGQAWVGSWPSFPVPAAWPPRSILIPLLHHSTFSLHFQLQHVPTSVPSWVSLQVSSTFRLTLKNVQMGKALRLFCL